jgi:hypothetical protein
LSTRRRPRRAHPDKRVMLVLAHVSSMKTKYKARAQSVPLNRL